MTPDEEENAVRQLCNLMSRSGKLGLLGYALAIAILVLFSPSPVIFEGIPDWRGPEYIRGAYIECEGTTRDSARIMRALSAVTPHGGNVLFARGECWITSPIVISPIQRNLTMTGAGFNGAADFDGPLLSFSTQGEKP